MTVSNPLISVIIPAYNKAQFLGESIESVCAQTVNDFEIIIVNDGSTDATSEIARSAQSRWTTHSITIIEKQNGGISDARNFGIEKARGKFITCLDGDDLIAPSYLAKALEIFRTSNATLVTCNVELFGSSSGEWIPEKFDTYVERYHNAIPTLVTYSKEIWQKNGGYKKAFPFNEDWDFFVSAEKFGLRVFKLEEQLFKYRVTSDGLAEKYIKDTWEYSFALITTSNESCYAVDRGFRGHNRLLGMPVRWAERFKAQDVLHPNEWLLKYWLAIVARSKGQIMEAKALYTRAIELSDGENWQPIFHLAELLAIEGDKLAGHYFHQCRLIRPDTELVVEERLKQIAEATKG